MDESKDAAQTAERLSELYNSDGVRIHVSLHRVWQGLCATGLFSDVLNR